RPGPARSREPGRRRFGTRSRVYMMRAAVQPQTLDHVAFWVADRAPVAEFLERHLGMHVIAREANFTLMGSDARRGKLTLFDADGPREQGAFAHVALRVSDLAAARAQLPDGASEVFDAGGGVRI